MVCRDCGKESADEFSFCPYCGKAIAASLPATEPPGPLPHLNAAPEVEANNHADVPSNGSDKIGTYVFGAFSAISALVSFIKGIVPIYLAEAAIWAACAWYWHRKKTHSELAKAIVIVLAALVAIGEVIQIASQFRSESKPTVASVPNLFDQGFASQPHGTEPSQAVTTSGASAASHVAEIEQQAVALFNQKQYKEARPLFDQACGGTDENGFKYAGFDGDMKACNYLGYLYAQGLGGFRDRGKARDLYQRACDEGVLSSCASLGSLYQDAGKSDEARKYFSKACQGGVTEACGLLHGVE